MVRARWAYSLHSISDVGQAIAADTLIAAALSLPLLILTAAVALPRMAADREGATSGAGHR